MQSLIPVTQIVSRNIHKGLSGGLTRAVSGSSSYSSAQSPPSIQSIESRVATISNQTFTDIAFLYPQLKKKVRYIKNVVKLEIALEKAEKGYWAKHETLQRCMDLQYDFFVAMTDYLKIKSSITKQQFVDYGRQAYAQVNPPPFYDQSESDDQAVSFLEGFFSLRSQFRSWIFRTYVGSCKTRFEVDPAASGAIQRMTLCLKAPVAPIKAAPRVVISA